MRCVSDSDHYHLAHERVIVCVNLCSYDCRRGDGQARVNTSVCVYARPCSRVRPPRSWASVPLGEAAPAVAHPVSGNPAWMGGSAF